MEIKKQFVKIQTQKELETKIILVDTLLEIKMKRNIFNGVTINMRREEKESSEGNMYEVLNKFELELKGHNEVIDIINALKTLIRYE